MSDNGRYYGIDEHTHTLRILDAILGGRRDAPGFGYVPDDEGAYVDWDLLLDGPISSTERAAVRIAWGCAGLEWAGGCPRLAGVLSEVVTQVAWPPSSRPVSSPPASVPPAPAG